MAYVSSGHTPKMAAQLAVLETNNSCSQLDVNMRSFVGSSSVIAIDRREGDSSPHVEGGYRDKV